MFGFAKQELKEGVNVLLYRFNGGVLEFLIQKRASTLRTAPGKWASTGGKIDDNETPEEAAKRECFEELGIELPHELKWILIYSTEKHLVYVYLIEQDIAINDIILQESEVEAIEWVTVDQIEKLRQNGNLFDLGHTFEIAEIYLNIFQKSY